GDVSTVTAVPYTHSQPVMDKIDLIQEQKLMKDTLKQKLEAEQDVQTDGIIDWIVQILLGILNLIQELIQFVFDLLQIVTLVEMIIQAVLRLINAVFHLIEAITDLFSPDAEQFLN
ncbi:MAG: hypothetical protein KGY50_03625, partial [Candidatus Thermoplasmatota archaeon]|nr:hypothetical protein [Candidatus Thermoplasmatota archaeon]